ncbi:hypothetical protein [Nocardiopsis lucentensis]|uniref:hypothetical protein n=1 Tax=Nocardiopsis lucentensis TaxID=53441 RepID=UPI00034B0F94|nr:hypothetical protein [Nocardiopsis lucentensis]
MFDAWMPGAERIDGGTAPGPSGIGAPRAVWTVTGSGPDAWSAREEALRLVEEGRSVHLVWNPFTGEVVQSLAGTRRSRMPLGRTSRYSLHVDHGHEGRVCLTVAVVARSEEPFTSGPMCGLSPILAWLDSWDIPRRWPAGPPGQGGTAVEELVRAWSRGGHFGHDQVPGSTSAGPGALDGARLFAGPATAESDLRSPPAPRRSDQQPSAVS